MKSVFRALGHLLRNLLVILLVFVVLLFAASYGIVYRATKNYKVVYGDKLMEQAQENGLDMHLLAGIVKTESDYRADVVAQDGGIGLMQLMPDTIDWLSKRLDEKIDPEALKDPERNLSYGASYMAYLKGRYQSEDLAIVAYNAGFTNVDQWLKEGTISWDYESMEKIPYAIPRSYVKKVNQAQEIYQIFYPDRLPEDSRQEKTYALAFTNLMQVFRYLYHRVF